MLTEMNTILWSEPRTKTDINNMRSTGWEAQLALHAYSRPFFSAGDFDRKVGQTDLVFGSWSEFIIDLRMQDYKSLCIAVTICSTLVKVQTHT